MAWENIARRQSQLAYRFYSDALLRWRRAKGGTTADQMANDLVALWANALDLWWGPFNNGDPLVPTLLIPAAPGGAGPFTGDARLAEDARAAQIAITPLGLVGANGVFGGVVAHNVIRRSTLRVQVTNAPNIVIGPSDVYQGLAMRGNEPVAVIVLKVG